MDELTPERGDYIILGDEGHTYVEQADERQPDPFNTRPTNRWTVHDTNFEVHLIEPAGPAAHAAHGWDSWAKKPRGVWRRIWPEEPE